MSDSAERRADDGALAAVAMPGSLMAIVAVVCALGSQIGERVPHGVNDAKIPATATELSNLPGQRQDGRTFLLEQRAGGDVDPILCASGTPPLTLRDLGGSAIVFCKGDTIPPALADQASQTEHQTLICKIPNIVE